MNKIFFETYEYLNEGSQGHLPGFEPAKVVKPAKGFIKKNVQKAKILGKKSGKMVSKNWNKLGPKGKVIAGVGTGAAALYGAHKLGQRSAQKQQQQQTQNRMR